jgi:hypothetical protein
LTKGFLIFIIDKPNSLRDVCYDGIRGKERIKNDGQAKKLVKGYRKSIEIMDARSKAGGERADEAFL